MTKIRENEKMKGQLFGDFYVSLPKTSEKMKGLISYTVNVNGTLMDLSEPQVMGILNITPDSFYVESRKSEHSMIVERVEQIIREGASIIDVGAYSSRPGANDVSISEEMERLRRGLEIIRTISPSAIVSVDTFRADVVRMCVEEYGVAMVNDISAGCMDDKMFSTVARLGVPYIIMHMQGVPQTMQQDPHYDHLMKEIFIYFAERIDRLRDLGVKDIILDPGFGFGKTLNHNYELMNSLEAFRSFELPVLVGVSRKSMIYKLLGGTADDALNGSTALHTIALLKGANILRVHDVKACVEVVAVVREMLQQT